MIFFLPVLEFKKTAKNQEIKTNAHENENVEEKADSKQ